MRLPVVIGTFLLGGAVAFAQSPQQPVFRGGVDLIEVDVSVVNDRGRPVTDVRAPEFTVTVDGKPRKVVSAEFISLRGQPPDGRRPTTETAEVLVSSNAGVSRGRLIVIAVDREGISFGSGRNATRAAGAFLDKLGPNDKVAFVSIPQPGPMVDFTSDHQRIRKGLEAAVGVAQRPGRSPNIGIYEAYALSQHSDSLAEYALLDRFCGTFPLNSSAYVRCESEVSSLARSVKEEVQYQTDTSLRSLRSLLEALRELEGPKSLVWISEGLFIDGPGGELVDIARLAEAARVSVNVLLLDAPLVDVSEAAKSPTSVQDRDMQMRGLELLSGMTRGALHRVSVGAEFAFERIEEELSGYYLLGVESVPGDVDGRSHAIRVSIRRQGVTVRSRREFQIRSVAAAATRETDEERVRRALRSPFAVTDLPLRVATYAYKDAADSKVRIVVAAEIERAAPEPAEFTVGLMLVSAEGAVVVNDVRRTKIEPVEGAAGPVAEHLGVLAVEPGTYTLKLAAIDAAGRRGSIEHPVQAWEMSGVPFAVSDLVLADVPPKAGEPLRPRVEARLAGDQLVAYLEAYADRPETFADLEVRVDVAADESGPALTSAPGSVAPASSETSRIITAVVPVRTLPPGRYVARASLMRGDEKVWESRRPFHVTAAAAAASLTKLIPAMLAPPAFERNDVLSADALAASMDVLERGRTGLKTATSRVRAGMFDGAARQAFDVGDQFAALFLRGLELFATGDLNRAGTQLLEVLRLAPDFTPAAVYLGACYAAGGRDRDAVLSWRRGIVGKDRLPLAYALLGDALIRLGEMPQALDLLREGVTVWPQDDELRRRLGLVYAMSLQHGDALATIEPYLPRHPTDHEALFVALQAIYAARLGGKPLLNDTDEQERMTRYGRAYAAAKGPHEALVAAWVASMRDRGKQVESRK